MGLKQRSMHLQSRSGRSSSVTILRLNILQKLILLITDSKWLRGPIAEEMLVSHSDCWTMFRLTLSEYDSNLPTQLGDKTRKQMA